MNLEYNIKEVEDWVSNRMDQKRFRHTLGVTDMSFSLALRYGCDEKKAVLAGLLHDCAKCLSDEILISECETYRLPISKYERVSPYLLHGKLGAYYGKDRFKIEDDDILNAITFHTTGRPNMSLLEKIVFVADFIEPSRKIIPKLQAIRKLSFHHLDKAVLEILHCTIHYLESIDKPIDTTTLEAYNYYINKIEK